MLGQTSVVADIFKSDARNMYNENWDGYGDLWKENYRRMKLRRFYTDRPITPETRYPVTLKSVPSFF